MRLILKLSLMALMAFAVVGCGSSDEDQASSIVAEHTALRAQINSMGTPSSSWSEKDLNDYIARLDRLASLESQAKSNDNVYGGNNSRAIEKNRRLAQNALSEKRRLAQKSKDRAEKQEKARSLALKSDTLKEEYLELFDKVTSVSFDKDSDLETLNKLVSDSSRGLEVTRQLIEVNNELSSLVGDRAFTQQLRELNNLLKDGEPIFEIHREAAQKILDERAAKLDIDQEALEEGEELLDQTAE